VKHTLSTAIESGIINEEEHRPLLDDLQHFVERAGITTETFYTPMTGCPEKVIKYVKQYRRMKYVSTFGLAFIGSPAHVPSYMAKMVACYLRNFTDATLCILDTAINDSVRNRSVLAIPDFYLMDPNQWRRDKMLTLLVEREAKQLQTIIGMSSGDPGMVFESLLACYERVEL
jgi:hypothetical protein